MNSEQSFKAQKMDLALIAIGILIVLLAICATPRASGSDLTKGYTFTLAEQNVTHTKLNNLVDAASINTTFFTDKSATTTPASADIFLIYSSSAGGFRKCTLGNLLFANTAVITGQTEDTTPAVNDYVLTYDASATLLKKAHLDSLCFTNDALINGRTNYTTPSPTLTYVLAYLGGNAYAKLTISNLFYQYANFSTFTNLAANTTPTNLTQLLTYDPITGTNRLLSLASLMTNVPTAAYPTNGDSFLMISYVTNAANLTGTNNPVSKQTIAGLITNAVAVTGRALTNTDKFAFFSTSTNSVPGITNTYARVDFGTISSNIVMRYQSAADIALATGALADTAHGLGASPQTVRGVLVCQTTELGYSVGDEVDANSAESAGIHPFAWGGNSTNVFASCADISFSIVQKASAARTAITAARWKLRLYAERYP